MGFRNIVITQESYVSAQAGYMVVTCENETKRIHLSEIDSVIFETPKTRISGYLINTLADNNIATIMCNELHQPTSILMPLHGNFHRSKNIKQQIEWDVTVKKMMWKSIIEQKITNQMDVLQLFEIDTRMLGAYVVDVQEDDKTNREGLAAKVYFRQLFGESFTRGAEDVFNWGLNYGYSIILMLFVRSICGKGYLTELGIKHTNEFNAYNLACDLMEPFRPLVDYFVKVTCEDVFLQNQRRKIQRILEVQVSIQGKKQYLSQAIELYTQQVLKGLKKGEIGSFSMDIQGVKEIEF